MSIQRSTKYIKSRLHRLTSGFLVLQRIVCLGKNLTKTTKTFRKSSEPELVEGVSGCSKVEANSHNNQCFTMGSFNKQQKGTSFNEGLSKSNISRSTYTEYILPFCPLKQPSSKRLLPKTSRSRNAYMVRTTYAEDDGPHASKRSINSLFQMNETYISLSIEQCKSEPLLDKKDNFKSRINEKYNSFNEHLLVRPHSLLITKIQNSFSKISKSNVKEKIDTIAYLEDYLLEYRNNPRSLESKALRSIKAADTLDSCILMIASLISE